MRKLLLRRAAFASVAIVPVRGPIDEIADQTE